MTTVNTVGKVAVVTGASRLQARERTRRLTLSVVVLMFLTGAVLYARAARWCLRCTPTPAGLS